MLFRSMGNCMKAKWVKKDGADLVPLKKDDEVEDTVQKVLQALKEADFSPDALSDKVSNRKEKNMSFRSCIDHFMCYPDCIKLNSPQLLLSFSHTLL